MHCISTIPSLKTHLAQTKGPIVLVPTMGALHDGHCALIRRAKEIAGNTGTVCASIFVNPIQFDRSEDLVNYPVTLEKDLEACEASGADLVFTPKPEEVYFADRSITVSENSLSRHLCGATRPGHFDGVCTVVLKLFMLFQADVAVFGKKDYQQLAVIRRMVRDLNIPIRIEGVETVRDADGLAMSSRNKRLDPNQRKRAIAIREGLLAARTTFQQGNTRALELVELAQQRILASAPDRIDYLTLVDAESLEVIDSPIQSKALLACAVFYGNVRLIDNIELNS